MGIRVEPTQINIWGTTPISEVYVWGTKIRPSTQWELFDETIASQSTAWTYWVVANVNGKLLRNCYIFLWWNWNYTISTRTVWADTYDVFQANNNHGNICIWLSSADFISWTSHAKVRVVIDYMYISPDPNYWDSVWLRWQTDAWCWLLAWNRWSKVTTWLWTNFEPDTPYSIEYEIDTSDYYTTYKLKNLNDNTFVTGSFTWQPFTETNSTYIINWWWPSIAVLVTDWGWWLVRWWMWNIHLYYKD